MNIENHNWQSPALGQSMDLKVYGWYGKPVLAFPAQGSSFHEFEDTGLLDSVSALVNSGKVKIFTVGSIDGQSWANGDAHPAGRAKRHLDYEKYIIGEVVPFIHRHCGDNDLKLLTCGVSMGGYHAANFFFKKPDIFDTMISMSGIFQLRSLIGDYMDDNVYFNSPIHYLPNMEDPWYLERYRTGKIVISVGQGRWEEPAIEDAKNLASILEKKGISCWLDMWGYDVDHDWPWWRKMLPYYLESLGI